MLYTIDISYNNVQGILNIPIMKHVSKKPVLTKVELQKKINGIFHALKNTSLNLTDNSITVKDPNNTSYIREYPYTEFKFKDFVYNLPIDWVNRLKEFEAVSFDSIVWDNSSRTWSYSGKIFEISPSQIEEEEKLKLEKKFDKQNETDNLLENSSNITNTKE